MICCRARDRSLFLYYQIGTVFLLNKNTLFRPSQSETKADSTNKIAGDMIEAETTARQDKTQRLRAARLERDA